MYPVVSVNENLFGYESGFLIDPLEESAASAAALEIESVWVVDRVGGSQYQGEVTLAAETDWVDVPVACMHLSFHSFQVVTHFIGGACHKTLGVPILGGAFVVAPGVAIFLLDFPRYQGYQTPGTFILGTLRLILF